MRMTANVVASSNGEQPYFDFIIFVEAVTPWYANGRCSLFNGFAYIWRECAGISNHSSSLRERRVGQRSSSNQSSESLLTTPTIAVLIDSYWMILLSLNVRCVVTTLYPCAMIVLQIDVWIMEMFMYGPIFEYEWMGYRLVHWMNSDV